MKHSGIFLILVLLLISVFFVACIQKTNTVPTTQINSQTIQTAAAQTLATLGTQPSPAAIEEGKYYLYLPSAFNNQQGDANQSNQANPTETPTEEPTPVPTNTRTPTATRVPDTPTPTTPPCLAAKFIQHINVPPGTQFTGGSKFTKIWRVQNVGSCPWYSNYTLVLVSGDGMGGGSDIPINASVAPGQTVDIMIDLTAPKNNGKYKSAWMLYNLAGQVFGVGNDATEYLWAEIKVVNSATATSKSSKASATVKPSATTAPSSTTAPSATYTLAPSSTNTPTQTPTFTDTPVTPETN